MGVEDPDLPDWANEITGRLMDKQKAAIRPPVVRQGCWTVEEFPVYDDAGVLCGRVRIRTFISPACPDRPHRTISIRTISQL